MIRNYTYKDHFKFGWGTGIYNFSDRGQQYWAEFGKAERQPQSFREECINSATLIAESTQKPILVCYSGGIDSEVILLSMVEAKIPCCALIMSMSYNGKSEINGHDLEYAFKFVKKYNIPYQVFVFDLSRFIKTCVIPYMYLYRTTVIGLLVHNEIVRKYSKDYLCVLGGGDIRLIRNRFNGYPLMEGMHIRENEKSTSAIQVAYENKSTVVNRFFMYTPELMLSWLENDDVKAFVTYEKSFEKITSTEIKPFVLHKMWPELISRPKYTGFEKVDVFNKENWNRCDPELVNVLNSAINTKFENSVVEIQYTDLIKMLK